MKSTLKCRLLGHKLLVLPLALAIGLLGENVSHGAKILLVVNSFSDPATTGNANDQEVLDRLKGQGHNVTLADDDVVSAADTAGMDLVLISSSVSSTAAGVNPLCINILRTGRIPVVCYEPGLYDELLMQTQNTFGNAGGHTSLAISVANKSHPLAAGKSGTIDIVDAGNTATVSSSASPYTVGTDAIIIATNATPSVDEGRICIWAYEKGARLADNVTVVPSRRVAFFYNASTGPGVYNTNATDLFDAAIKWTLAPPPNLPITVTFRSPQPQNSVPDAAIIAELEDGTTAQLNTNTISLSLNGNRLTPAVSKSGKVTTVSFTPLGLLPTGSSNIVRIVYSDSSTPAVTYTNVFPFTVESYVTLLPGMKVATTTIDRSKPGFTIKLRMMSVARPGGNSLATVRTQLNDGFVDPGTGQPYQDLIDRSQTGFPAGSRFNADGTFTEGGVINYSEVAPGGAEFGDFRAPAFPDKAIPGIPGIDGSNDNIAMEARTVLELKAGVYRFAVNSDDGFGVTVVLNSQDAFAFQAGAFDADRAQARTEFTVAVAEDGLYPFNLIWWESGGDAEVEFFSINRTTGQLALINDTANTNAVKAFQPPANSLNLPFVKAVSPKPGAVSVPKNATIAITITDGTIQVITNSIVLSLNGTVVSPVISKTGKDTSVSFNPANSLQASSTNTVILQFSDNASPPNTRSNSFSFVVESALPKALFLSSATPTASDNLVVSRLQALGFEVVPVADTASQTSDATGKDLIVISSSVGSGNIGTKFTAAPVPILHWEWALLDELGLEADNVNGLNFAGQTDIQIVDASHPLAAGLSAGVKTVLTTGGDMGYPNNLVSSAKIIAMSVAQADDGNKKPVLYAVEKGAALNGASIASAPARRVGFFLANDTFINATDDGKKLFDAAVKWLTEGLAAPPAKFAPPVLQGNTVVVSWTGAGTLQQADAVTGQWVDAPSQANPQTVPASGAMKFFRIRQ